jgi:hypothetical protein
MPKHKQAPYPIGDLFFEYLSTFSPVVPSVGEAHQKACHTYGVLGLEGGLVLDRRYLNSRHWKRSY